MLIKAPFPCHPIASLAAVGKTRDGPHDLRRTKTNHTRFRNKRCSTQHLKVNSEGLILEVAHAVKSSHATIAEVNPQARI